MAVSEVYSDLIRRARLDDHHVEALKARGFGLEVIEKYKMRSCGEYMSGVISSMMDSYPPEQLVQSKILTANPRMAGDIHVNTQLLADNILIPYIDHTGQVIKVRPHKLGFKDQPPLVYRTIASYHYSAEPICVIAESEFKAIAAECFGFPAIGIPGIASMSGQHLEYFASVLRSIKASEFVICFDNETKDNPAFKNYKQDWKRRYDTIIYAFVMASKIQAMVGTTCRVATLPCEWMVDGKIDIDMALSQGRTAQEFKDVIYSAVPPGKFIDTAPIDPKHVGFVNRRKRAFFNESNVFVRNNCFMIKTEETAGRGKDKETREVEKRMMNGHIYVKHTLENLDDGVSREFVIVDEYGQETRPVTIDASDMSSKKSFSSWLMRRGNFVFYGSDSSMASMWEYVFDNDESGVVFVVNNSGWSKEHGFWIFKNVLIKDGVSYEPDDQGIFWLDGIGYKPGVLNEEIGLPSLCHGSDFDMQKYISLLSDTSDFSEPGMAKAMIAWFIATLFCHEIHKGLGFFQLFFIYGTKGSGKTTVVRWLSSLLGMHGMIGNLIGSTTVGISRTLGFYSNIPVLMDDWRDVPEAKRFIPFLLSVYNRQGVVKGVKAAHGIASYPVKASLAILGEELINDAGLASRCVQFYMPTRRKRECYDEMDRLYESSSAFAYKILTDRYDEKSKLVIENINQARRDLAEVNDKLESRIINNYAVLKGVWETVFEPDNELNVYIRNRLTEGQREMNGLDKLVRFAEQFNYCYRNNDLNGMIKFDRDHIKLWMPGVCNKMNNILSKSGIDPFDPKLLTKHFCQQEYYAGMVSEVIGPTVSKVPLIVLRFSLMNETMREYMACGISTQGYRYDEDR